MEADIIADYKAMLAQKLGAQDFAKYLEALRDLFGQKLTKETFDLIVSPFLNGDALVLHNLMILGILRKCDKEAKTSPIIVEIPENREIVPAVVEEDCIETIEDNQIIVPVILYKGKPEDMPPPVLHKRFPVGFAEKYQKISGRSKVPPDFVPNVTHLYDIEDRLNENAAYRTYFPTPKSGQPFTSYNSTFYGKCFLKVWGMGCEKIEIDAIDTAADFTYNHMKEIIAAMIRQRKAFRRHQPKINSAYTLIGNSYPNPYLNQGFHSYDMFKRPEVLTLGEAMQVPDHISSVDERERLGVMRIAAECPLPAPSQYLRKALGAADLLAVMKDNPRLISDARMKMTLMSKILEKLNCASRINSPLEERRNVFEPTFDVEEVADEKGELMPSCNY